MNKVIAGAVGAAVIVFLGIIIWLGSGARSATETALSSVLLTLVSVAATWIVSHAYHIMAATQEIERVTLQHDESLKTYARKAAEKVTNLSNELSRLSSYLTQYLEYQTDGDSLDVVMSQRDERLTGAIHIVEMLRSVNDTSLSDWYGVIGEELEKKKERQEETEARREQTVIGALDKISHMLEEYRREPRETIDESRIIAQIEDMRAELTGVALGLRAPFAARLTPSPFGIRNKVYLPCPSCQSDVEIKHSRAGKVKYKSYVCGSCHTRIVVRPSTGGEPIIELRHVQAETVNCPLCGRRKPWNSITSLVPPWLSIVEAAAKKSAVPAACRASRACQLTPIGSSKSSYRPSGIYSRPSRGRKGSMRT